jgi:acetyltransferase-like isoleucine patch superfamily enzyme
MNLDASFRTVIRYVVQAPENRGNAVRSGLHLGPCIGRAALWCYKTIHRLASRCVSTAISGAFAGFGKRSVLDLPVRLSGEQRIVIGDDVFIGPGSWLQTVLDDENHAPAVRIGNRTSIAGACVISAARSVVLEEDVLLARNVYVADHIHRYSDVSQPIREQGIDKVLPVLIRRGAWLGQNVVVCPGVTIGVGSVIGANSTVKSDIPDFSVAVGSPARVVRRFGASDASACSD